MEVKHFFISNNPSLVTLNLTFVKSVLRLNKEAVCRSAVWVFRSEQKQIVPRLLSKLTPLSCVSPVSWSFSVQEPLEVQWLHHVSGSGRVRSGWDRSRHAGDQCHSSELFRVKLSSKKTFEGKLAHWCDLSQQLKTGLIFIYWRRMDGWIDWWVTGFQFLYQEDFLFNFRR